MSQPFTISLSHRPFPVSRETIENEIERLIALLDAADGDADFEDNGDDEPFIGSTPICVRGEIQHDLELDTSDYEPNGDELDTCYAEDEGGYCQ